MDKFRQYLSVHNHISFDSFCIDCGWPNPHTIWQMDKTNFPVGFTKVRRAALSMGTDLGIWISPGSCCDFVLDQEWAGKQGYEAMPSAAGNGTRFGLCLAGHRYQSELRRQVVDCCTYIRMAGICCHMLRS